MMTLTLLYRLLIGGTINKLMMKSEKCKFKYLIVILFLLLNIQKNFAVNAESAYLQTDRDVFVAGESLFYKLYVVNAQTKIYSSTSKTGYITLRNINGINVLKARVLIGSGMSSGSFLLPDTLSSGVYQLLAYTNLMRNLDENNYFSKEIIITNRHDKEFNYKLPRCNFGFVKTADSSDILVNKVSFSQREKVVVNLGKRKGNLAVSVYEDPQIQLFNKNIVETFTEVASSAYDNSQLKYPVEDRTQILSAKVIDENSGIPLKNVIVLLTTPDTIPNLQYQKTDNSGYFHMPLSPYYDGKTLYFNVVGLEDGVKSKIVFDDKYKIDKKWNPELFVNNGNSGYFSTSSKLFYINKFYENTDREIFIKTDTDKAICPKLYNCLSNSVFPADFVQLKDFREIVSELLPKVRLVNNDGKYGIYIINSVTSMLFQKQPAIFLDGVLIDNVDYIMGMGSEDIKRIDVVDAERVYGNLLFHGVISITSNSEQNLKQLTYLNKNKVVNDTVNHGMPFSIIDPEKYSNSNAPLLKQLLYWNPGVFSGEDDAVIEFYTSDYLSSYIIKVEGLSENGNAFYAVKTFKVENNKDTK